jgi:ubiquinone/menaquinone biosynthesis C-methylase UbiE
MDVSGDNMAGDSMDASDDEPGPVTEPTPFRRIDELPTPMRALLLGALDGMAATPEIRQVRRVADEALRPVPGERILDAGCGAGEVARALAALVTPGGRVTAADASQVVVEYAQSKDDGAGVEYRVADIAALPFEDGAFDAVRCERVLQHLADPDAGLAELTRVTRRGGRVCLIDTDWTSLAVDGLPEDLLETVIGDFWSRRFLHQSSMGRTLRRRLSRAGLSEVSAQPLTLYFTDPEAAAVILPMFNPMVPAEAKMVPDELRELWFGEIAAAKARDEFLAVLTMWVAVGAAPDRARD